MATRIGWKCVPSVESLGRAIHAAKRVGGPWGPACGYVEYPTQAFIRVKYNTDPTGEFACECESMAKHLVELMEAN
jgi:hypothetical protein